MNLNKKIKPYFIKRNDKLTTVSMWYPIERFELSYIPWIYQICWQIKTKLKNSSFLKDVFATIDIIYSSLTTQNTYMPYIKYEISMIEWDENKYLYFINLIKKEYLFNLNMTEKIFDYLPTILRKQYIKNPFLDYICLEKSAYSLEEKAKCEIRGGRFFDWKNKVKQNTSINEIRKIICTLTKDIFQIEPIVFVISDNENANKAITNLLLEKEEVDITVRSSIPAMQTKWENKKYSQYIFSSQYHENMDIGFRIAGQWIQDMIMDKYLRFECGIYGYEFEINIIENYICFNTFEGVDNRHLAMDMSKKISEQCCLKAIDAFDLEVYKKREIRRCIREHAKPEHIIKEYLNNVEDSWLENEMNAVQLLSLQDIEEKVILIGKMLMEE